MRHIVTADSLSLKSNTITHYRHRLQTKHEKHAKFDKNMKKRKEINSSRM